MKVFLLALLVIYTSQSFAVSFSSAKKKLYKKVYPNYGETFYCGCNWSKKKVDLNSCGLSSVFPKKQRKRSKRTEAEHIIPASWMYKKNGVLRSCAIEAKQLKKSARKYCQKNDYEYKQAHNDLVNLFPAVGQINADRSNKPFVEKFAGGRKIKKYGQCNVTIGSRGIIPAPSVRGDIARVGFYMAKKYGVSYSKRQSKLYEKWDKEDPISSKEIKRNMLIKTIQGFSNDSL